MRVIDLSNIEEARSFTNITPGGYICQITSVQDFANKEYLKIEFDIAQGDFKNYYFNLCANKGFWGGSFLRSYKEKALPFFKSFITSAEKSNKNYTFDSNEQTLVKKYIGLILGEEEYGNKLGEIKTRTYVNEVRSVSSIQNKEFETPALKKLQQNPKQNSFQLIEDDGDLPF